MITIKVPQDELSANQLLLLKNIEKDTIQYAKELLNTSNFKHIQVCMQWYVEHYSSQCIIIHHNASFSIQGSLQFASLIHKYLDRSGVPIALPKHSLVLSLNFKEKESHEPSSSTSKMDSREIEETHDFFPQKPRYSFGQIILSDDIKSEIINAMKVIECKDLIYNIWGFGEIEPIPKSILNLYGPPGTGKTMCAHAIAKHLRKDILALNYSEIESKYVGEAPKNLQKAFDVAKATDSVLFFDEADSFLGKRIQNVSHGSDQALNSLRSQMLILLEDFSGVVVFATNLVTNFDKAFESRILKHIRFELPNEIARASIIKSMIPKQLPLLTPLSEADIMEVSKMIDGFSGREIKVAILDMLLEKAATESNGIYFTAEDLFQAFRKKKESIERLKAEENILLKEKIAKKLKEKIEFEKAQQSTSESIQ